MSDGTSDTPRLRIGIGMPAHYEGRPSLDVVALARLAEELGYADLWLPDHASTRRPIGDLQVMAGLSAGATERIRICTGVIQGPIRHPLLLARWLGGLSAEIPGRLLAGIGLGGDDADEWRRLGLDARERVSLFEELLAVLGPLLENRHVRHRGTHFEFDVPPMFGTTPPPVPLWIGARAPAAARRALRATGWMGMLQWPHEFRAQMDQLHELADARGVARPRGGMSLAASIVGTEHEARERCAQYFRRSWGLGPGRGTKRAIGGMSQLGDLLEEFEDAGAELVCITLVDEPRRAWPILAEALELDRTP